MIAVEVKPELRRRGRAWVCRLPAVWFDPCGYESDTPKSAWMGWALARKAAGLLPWG